MTSTNVVSNGASRQIWLACITILLLAGFCFGQPNVTLSPTSGSPTTHTLVSGSGFAPYAAIDIYFDTVDEALALSRGHPPSSNGAVFLSSIGNLQSSILRSETAHSKQRI